MLEKIKNLGNLPLVIILIIVIIIAVVLSILKAQKTEGINSNANVSNIKNSEETQEEQEPQENYEEEIIDAVDIEDEEEAVEEEANSNAKYFIRVNYGQNVVTIYTKDTNGEYTVPYKAMVCSTGTATPRSGTYVMPSSGSKSPRGVWGMMIGNVWAQYYTRIKGSILFHSVPYTERNKWSLEYWEYDKLGTAASAGCIRLTVEDAKWIYNNCPAGTKVEFYTDSNPGPLGKPTAQKISEEEEVRGWDPTDPDGANPWITYTPSEDKELEEDETTTKPAKPTTKPTTNPTTPSNPTAPEEIPEQNPSPEVPSEDENSGDNQEGSGTEGEENTNPGEEEKPNPDENVPGGDDSSGDNADDNSGESGGEQEGGTSGEGTTAPDENTTVTPETELSTNISNV